MACSSRCCSDACKQMQQPLISVLVFERFVNWAFGSFRFHSYCFVSFHVTSFHLSSLYFVKIFLSSPVCPLISPLWILFMLFPFQTQSDSFCQRKADVHRQQKRSAHRRGFRISVCCAPKSLKLSPPSLRRRLNNFFFSTGTAPSLKQPRSTAAFNRSPQHSTFNHILQHSTRTAVICFVFQVRCVAE